MIFTIFNSLSYLREIIPDYSISTNTIQDNVLPNHGLLRSIFDFSEGSS